MDTPNDVNTKNDQISSETLGLPVRSQEDAQGLAANYITKAVRQATLPISIIYAILLPIMFIGGLFLGYSLWGREANTAQATAPQVIVKEVVVTPTNSPSAIQGDQSAEAQSQAVEENSVPTTAPSSTEAADNGEKQQVTRYAVSTDDDPYIGPEDAKITIIEFSDYQCPYCTRWHNEVFTKILQDYPDDVRIVYRDFPLESIHPEAIPAAEAANCALEQGYFWEFHTLLFEGGLGLGKDNYIQYAEQLNLDRVQFEECISGRKYQAEVQADFDFAANLGVRSTPTFFINGIALVGAQPYDVFQQVIEGELAGVFE